ncbi:hypothetical protein CWI36_0390p0020 [Hamiltosporidium magnivora]|uniref:Uncharacterized protein n=1 Tax=Hamiltosporidium magnivora TaxID=148818 RepID=A0A4Q9LIB3_9MICR|nr:hypothetical protein CWI36_0390p0020 [Hamiltosporidium magnivora]
MFFIVLAVIYIICATNPKPTYDMLLSHFEQINNVILSSVQDAENEFIESLDQEVHRINIGSKNHRKEIIDGILETFPEKSMKVCFFIMLNSHSSYLEEYDAFLLHRINSGLILRSIKKDNLNSKENTKTILVINRKPFLNFVIKFISNMKNVLRNMGNNSINPILSSIGFLMKDHKNMTNHFLTGIYKTYYDRSQFYLDIILVTQRYKNIVFLDLEKIDEGLKRSINFYKIYRLDFEKIKDYFIELNLKTKYFFLNQIISTLGNEIDYYENEEPVFTQFEKFNADFNAMKIYSKKVIDITGNSKMFDLENIYFCKIAMKKQNLHAFMPEKHFAHIKLFHFKIIIYTTKPEIFNIRFYTKKTPLQNIIFLLRVSSIFNQQKHNHPFLKIIIKINKMNRTQKVLNWKEFLLNIKDLLQYNGMNSFN